MQAILSFEQAPPMAAPVRFFLTAPLFAALAGGLLVIAGEGALVSRWSPLTLALVHLLTIGFLLQVMLGALVQIMPVVVGANMRRPLWVARGVHGSLVAGALALVAAFLSGMSMLFIVAAALLSLAVGLFLGAAALALRRVPNTSPTIPAIKIALGGLAVTVTLGLALLGVLAAGWSLPLMQLTDLHAMWGLLGWSAALVAGVAYVVVPMFQLTPGYRARFSQWFVPLLLLAIFAWMLARLAEINVLAVPLGLVMGGLVAAFAVVTLRLQQQSKRSRPDATVRFWQVGMLAALLATACGAALAVGVESERLRLLLGVLALVGGLMSVINGMLYKIVPFLCWLHLQNLAASLGGARVPHMGEFLGESKMRRQLWVHLAALGSLVLAVFFPALVARPAGVLVLVSALLLGWNLLTALRCYQAAAARFRSNAAAPAVAGATGS